jgi:DNA topoisomerase-1
MKLVIVESPSKCKKIESLLGNGYRCKASVGHICEIANGLKGIDHQTLLPTYRLLKGKAGVVKKLGTECRGADNTVFLATDPDREGEAIAYHLCLFLKLCPRTTPRVRFHELTRDAVGKAFAEPSRIDMNLVRAQQARQVLDLYVGYKISPFLWKAVGPRLSAGRCQTPALRMLWQREQQLRDPRQFTSRLHMTADFDHGLVQSILLQPPAVWKDFLTVVDRMKKNPCFEVKEVKTTTKRQNPPPPFITSSIQQDCHTTFHYSPSVCMSILQSLYEKGKITYMRTDSPALSETAMTECREQVEKQYGTEFSETRVYASSSATSQEAHEAIRPTRMAVKELAPSFTEPERKVYLRIWRRTMASQMVAYRFSETVTMVQHRASSSVLDFQHTGRQSLHMGWKIVYGVSPETSHDPVLLGTTVLWQRGEVVQEYEKGRGRHSEATLIRELEKHGIGRPSTFASLCTKILERRYAVIKNVQGITVSRFRATISSQFFVETKEERVTLGTDHGKYVVSETGQQVLAYLSTHFPWLLDYSFTRGMEADLETIVSDQGRYHAILESYLSKIG